MEFLSEAMDLFGVSTVVFWFRLPYPKRESLTYKFVKVYRKSELSRRGSLHNLVYSPLQVVHNICSNQK